MVGAPARRLQVAYVRSRGLSQRRACALLSTSRSSLHYESRLEARDKPLMVAMTDLAETYPRFGYRRINVFMERQGHFMGVDKAFRLWSKDGLQVPRKRPRKRVAASRPRPQLPMGANELWAYDFVYDACANGQQIKCLTVVDDDAGESGYRRCRQHQVVSGYRGVVAPDQRTRSPSESSL
jgi:putative transposase